MEIFRISAIAAAALGMANPAWAASPLPPPVYATDTPSQLTGAVYADLSGILRPPHAPAPQPMWWSYLSARTASLRERLAELEAEGGPPAFDYDWLCQCRDTRKFRAQPRIVVESSSDESADLRVGIVRYGGNVATLHLLFVYEDGWRIDDIVDGTGRRYSAELAHAIAERGKGPVRLPDPQAD